MNWQEVLSPEIWNLYENLEPGSLPLHFARFYKDCEVRNGRSLSEVNEAIGHRCLHMLLLAPGGFIRRWPQQLPVTAIVLHGTAIIDGGSNDSLPASPGSVVALGANPHEARGFHSAGSQGFIFIAIVI